MWRQLHVSDGVCWWGKLDIVLIKYWEAIKSVILLIAQSIDKLLPLYQWLIDKPVIDWLIGINLLKMYVIVIQIGEIKM